ncbi:transcriptional regulator [Methylobacterium tarhaniae]|uniref:Transcriptional regulator n=2 Tax=Methylobacterium tarhaniae TaxID=1187852 RepID=A0A0J6T1L5_9HYPH|nr:transcriptional regulator [Methylobacterium tarhaniae]
MEPNRSRVGDLRGSAALPHGFVGAHALQAVRAVLAEMGTSPEEVCRNAAIDLRVPYEMEAVSFASLGRLMAAAADRIGCGHLGLLVGQRTDLLSCGPLGTLVRHSRTIDEALGALETHYVLLSRGATIERSTDGLVATVTYAPYDPDAAGIAHHCERALGALTGVMRSLCGADWCPDEVWLPRLAPADPSPYASYFRAPVRFSQEITALVFPARLLRRPILGADPVLRAAAEHGIRCAKAAIPFDLSHEVRRCVRSRATRSRIGKDEIAQALALNPRTLCRRLRAGGTTFRSITNQTRLGIAKQLLADTTMGLAEISAVLEFSEPAAFTHAFRRWTGMAPSAWRQDHRTTRPPN